MEELGVSPRCDNGSTENEEIIVKSSQEEPWSGITESCRYRRACYGISLVRIQRHNTKAKINSHWHNWDIFCFLSRFFFFIAFFIRKLARNLEGLGWVYCTGYLGHTYDFGTNMQGREGIWEGDGLRRLSK